MPHCSITWWEIERKLLRSCSQALRSVQRCTWLAGTVISWWQSVFFCLRRHLTRGSARDKISILSWERESCRFLCWVISSMQGSLYHKIQKSSQFYLISWNGKVFSRSLIKCFLTEGACLPGRPAPLSESLREKREKYKNSLQRSYCTTEPPPLLMSEATLHNWRTI